MRERERAQASQCCARAEHAVKRMLNGKTHDCQMVATPIGPFDTHSLIGISVAHALHTQIAHTQLQRQFH